MTVRQETLERGDQALRTDRPSTGKAAVDVAPAEAEVSAARALIMANLPLLRGSDWVIEVDLGDGAKFLIDTESAVLLPVKNARRTVDCSLTVTPLAVTLILTGGLDPRYAMLYDMMRIVGSARAATKMWDQLAGRKILSQMPGASERHPRPTCDLARATADLREFGYCMVSNALTVEQIGILKTRVVEQAQAEREAGTAWLDGNPTMSPPPNQRVWNLSNKGKVFLDLLDHSIVDYFCLPFLGDNFLLSSYQANIAGPGGQPMFLHNDQISTQPPVPEVALGLNILWFLDDVTEQNGGTRILPGSHTGKVAPDNVYVTDGTIAAQGPAGTAFIFESRVWHGTGANIADTKRHVLISFFVRSWLRTVENSSLSLKPDVYEKMTDRLKTMHGFRCTGSLGGIDGPVEGYLATPHPKVVGELHL